MFPPEGVPWIARPLVRGCGSTPAAFWQAALREPPRVLGRRHRRTSAPKVGPGAPLLVGDCARPWPPFSSGDGRPAEIATPWPPSFTRRPHFDPARPPASVSQWCDPGLRREPPPRVLAAGSPRAVSGRWAMPENPSRGPRGGGRTPAHLQSSSFPQPGRPPTQPLFRPFPRIAPLCSHILSSPILFPPWSPDPWPDGCFRPPAPQPVAPVWFPVFLARAPAGVSWLPKPGRLRAESARASRTHPRWRPARTGPTLAWAAAVVYRLSTPPRLMADRLALLLAGPWRNGGPEPGPCCRPPRAVASCGGCRNRQPAAVWRCCQTPVGLSSEPWASRSAGYSRTSFGGALQARHPGSWSVESARLQKKKPSISAPLGSLPGIVAFGAGPARASPGAVLVTGGASCLTSLPSC